jgi:acetyl esterase/lipase
MYRLTALPFLEKNMAVAVVGYRTYPDGNVNDQVNDLHAAFRTFELTFPQYMKPSPRMVDEKKEWSGVSLIGHSSGAHISMLALIQQLENKLDQRGNKPTTKKMINFDSFVSLCGVFSISEHFYFEVGRGVEEMSPMKPACGYDRESFEMYSPTNRLLNMVKKDDELVKSFCTKMLFIHGIDDDVVPFTSTQKLVSAVKQVGPTPCVEYYLPNVNHIDLVTGLMFGGQSKDIILNWLDKKI